MNHSSVKPSSSANKQPESSKELRMTCKIKTKLKEVGEFIDRMISAAEQQYKNQQYQQHQIPEMSQRFSLRCSC